MKPNELTAALKAAVLSLGWTAPDLGRALGVSRQFAHQILTGAVAVPVARVERAEAIARAGRRAAAAKIALAKSLESLADGDSTEEEETR